MTLIPPGFVIAGTHSGVGKTSITLGLIKRMQSSGLKVQAFKVGPDFIDPGLHQLISQRPSGNLDGWLLTKEQNQALFAEASKDADVVIVEGMMGLFDGLDGKSERGSTAEIARWLNLPIVLVVDAWAMARSAAAMIHGFVSFDPSLKFAGVICNRVASLQHLSWIREAVEGLLPVPLLGGVMMDRLVHIEERHLGLHTAAESEALQDKVERLARSLEFFDVAVVSSPSSRDWCLSKGSVGAPTKGSHKDSHKVKIGVAQDKAFCFYYQENLKWLVRCGAELVFFSPLKGEWPSSLDGLYLGGGYPEVHLEELGAQREWFSTLRQFVKDGGSVYAECGGLMCLSGGIETLDGRKMPMAGVFPGWTRMTERYKLGYSEVTVVEGQSLFPLGEQARGQRFHCSELIDTTGLTPTYQVSDGQGGVFKEGFAVGRSLVSYIHLHWGSNPAFAAHWIQWLQS